MNNTKWNELRLEMDALDPTPSWSTMCTNGHRSDPDREWFHHSRAGGYDDILYVDILVDDLVQRELVRSALKRIHVPGEEMSSGFRVLGYLQDGQTADFI